MKGFVHVLSQSQGDGGVEARGRVEPTDLIDQRAAQAREMASWRERLVLVRRREAISSYKFR